MKLLIIRHGEPDYKNDSLTEKGRREAECLAEYLSRQLGPHVRAAKAGKDRPGAENQDRQTLSGGAAETGTENGSTERQVYFYMSPLGRAQETAEPTLQKLGCTAEVLPWLREFDVFIDRPDDQTKKRVPWDWPPKDWTEDPRFYLADHWFENERMAASNVGGEYRKVTEHFDELLARHGYRREGGYYRAGKPNHDIIVLFCHFGLEGVLLSYIWGVSPMPVWHGTCAAPASVTTLVTEERREGIASLRMLTFGDTTHLYLQDEEPSFAARFCECFEDGTRH